MSLRTVFLAVSIIILVVSASPTQSADPLLPSQDPWYTAPFGYENEAPGNVLRLRSAPGNFTSTFNASSAAYNILYRTTDSNYKPSWAVTTLFVPHHSTSSILLSYQIPYNSPDVDSSPSYSLHNPVEKSSALINIDIQHALEFGWYVSVPDHEGPLASFGLGVQEGHAVLDSVRAVLETGFGLATDARYALWGYSGGSIAIGGLPVNLKSIISNSMPTLWSGLIPLALLGITRQDHPAYEYLTSQLKTSGPYNKTGFLAGAHMTIEEAFVAYADQTIPDYFVNGTASLEAPILQRVLNRTGYMGYHGVPQMPLYVYKATQDEIAPIEDADRLVKKYCDVGANVQYERNVIGGHLAEETNGDASAFRFLQRVLEGTYHLEGCTIRNVAINITDSLE